MTTALGLSGQPSPLLGRWGAAFEGSGGFGLSDGRVTRFDSKQWVQ